jgi:hypothetical protein
MTTERTWYTSSIALESVSPLDMGNNLTIETYAVRKGSQVLWGIKESLVGTGHWEVVSCYFRKFNCLIRLIMNTALMLN